MSRRSPAKQPVSLRLPARLSRWIDRTVRADDRIYNRSHLIEEALLFFQAAYEEDEEAIELEDDATDQYEEDEEYEDEDDEDEE